MPVDELVKVAGAVSGGVAAIGALSKPLVKLIEVVESGIGALGRPFMLVVTAHTEGQAKLIREGYVHRLKKLKIKHRLELATLGDTKRLPSPKTVEDIEVLFEEAEPSENVADQMMVTEQQAKRRANVVTIAAEAAEQMGENVADEPVGADWIARFFTDAQDVSPADLQHLWGKVLAAEVGRPGCVPLRTLEMLRNLSQDEARLFEKLVSFCASGGSYVRINEGGLTTTELMTLQDAGLLEPAGRHLKWHAIEPGSPDHEAARARFLDRFENRLHPSPYASTALPYPSGHALLLQVASTQFVADAFAVRPSAVPLFKLVYRTTSLAYLRAVVGFFNAQPFFQAWVREPSGWTGESLGEGTKPPSLRPEPDASPPSRNT